VATSTNTGRSTAPARHPARWWRRATLAGLLVGSLLVVLAVVAAQEGTLSSYRPGWDLILQDEFDEQALDAGVWNAEDLPSFRNNELQYYTPDLLGVGDGHLRLTSDRTPREGRPFSSAAVDTYGKFSFTYGRVEVRAKLPQMARACGRRCGCWAPAATRRAGRAPGPRLVPTRSTSWRG
jgi:beta-glucanase (GH16 family)